MDPIRIELTTNDLLLAVVQQARIYAGLPLQIGREFRSHINIAASGGPGTLAATVSFIALDQRPTHQIVFK